MRLQVNNSGAWKQVLTFGIEHIEEVKASAADLALTAEVADSPVAWRILDSTDRAVLMYSHRHVPRWYTPPWMLGREIVP